MKKAFVLILLLPAIFLCSRNKNVPTTEITKWQYAKDACISLTYDDATITQFRVALPLMEQRGFRGTFFINSGRIPGSTYKPKFIGRPIKKIISETEKFKTNKENYFERSSVLGYLSCKDWRKYQREAFRFYQRGEFDKAFNSLDDFFHRYRNNEIEMVEENNTPPRKQKYKPISWDEIREIALRGHEFAAHTISHAYLPALDEANIIYEIEKCRENIEEQLGKRHTFSIECAYGIKDERVLNYVYQRFPLNRNKISDTFVDEILRGDSRKPELNGKEYIQWQRGPHTDTPMETMKEWVDTSIKNNVWLVLVFHGIDGMGYEPKTGEEIKEYFDYIKSKEDNVWVATFQDAAKYMRERMSGNITAEMNNSEISVSLSHSLDPDLYNFPLTLKTYVPAEWYTVSVEQENHEQEVPVQKDIRGSYIIYLAEPNAEKIILKNIIR